MKKILSITLIPIIVLSLCVSVTATEEQSAAFVSESVTREELMTIDPKLDSDGDGLADVIELVYEFNRHHPDTDGDGVTDYTEFCITCTNVLLPDGDIDTDGDGLTNAEESIYGTNPDDLDSDNDNFSDYDEIINLSTDPLVKNVIANEMPNKSELVFPYTVPINPNTAGNTLAIDPPTEEDFGPGDDSGDSGGTTHSGTLYTKYDGITYSSSVAYTMNFNWFFGNNAHTNRSWRLSPPCCPPSPMMTTV